MPPPAGFTKDIGLIGGGGHAGLPLALMFADAGLKTVIYDLDRARVETIRGKTMPFMEEGADEILPRVIDGGLLEVSDDPAPLAACRFLVLIVGTPVDEHLNPDVGGVLRAVDSCRAVLRDGQILILRSTLFPGVSQHVKRRLDAQGVKVSVAFCPERVAQGVSLREFRTLPQIISAFDEATLDAVRRLFGRFTDDVIEMAPMEAELAKLFTNAWRYLQFAAANQFYMIAQEHGLDFARILHGCRYKYPRTAGLPGPGLAAGPCLVKDTMQLAAFSGNSFVLGHAAMLVNEGLPYQLVRQAQRARDLRDACVGILGMAFKAESDDPRGSLSYRLKKLLELEARTVLCTDPYVRDPRLVPLDRVRAEADVIFLATPHRAYRNLDFRPETLVINVWGEKKC